MIRVAQFFSGQVNGFFYPRATRTSGAIYYFKYLVIISNILTILLVYYTFFYFCFKFLKIIKFPILVSRNIRRIQWRMQREWLTQRWQRLRRMFSKTDFENFGQVQNPNSIHS
jgi:hypothetical protein